MSMELETPRLLLRPLRLADAETIQELFPHWDIVRYLASVVPWPYPADGATTYYCNDVAPTVAREDEWHWGIWLKGGPDHLIGTVALMKDEINNRGFWLGLPWHGRGLMSEAVLAVTDYWFDELKFSVLRVPKAIANTASRRISEKYAMRVIAAEERNYVSGRLLSEIWEVTAEEWREYRRLSSGRT